METTKFFSYLMLLLIAAFLTGCPIDEDDLLGDYTLTIVNDNGPTITEVTVDEDCTAAWIPTGTTTSIATGGGTADFSVPGSIGIDTYDVMACDAGGANCVEWWSVTGSVTLTWSVNDIGPVPKRANCP